jgi:hypothetical protein
MKKHETSSVKVKVTLRPTASRPVYPGVRPPSAAHDKCFLFFAAFYYGVSSMTRGLVCNFHLLLNLARAVFGSESL